MEGARYLEDGRLVIFKRSGVFYARIRSSPSGKYIWRSLKTTDEQIAIRAGRKLFYSLEHRVELGLPPKSKLFSAVIDDYVRFRERDHRHGKTSDGMLRQIIRVAKFWRECSSTFFRRSGVFYVGIRLSASGKYILALTEDHGRADCHSSWSQVAVPNRTESRPRPSAEIQSRLLR